MLTVILYATATYGQVCSTEENVDINIFPGTHPNVIDPGSERRIPVVIFGSEKLKASKVDPQSLRLRVNALWEASRVETDTTSRTPLCEIRDVGSPNKLYSDSLGPQDGYMDLLCQFTNELAIIQGGVQPVTLTGLIPSGEGGEESPVTGFDSASGPGGLKDIVRCCISCDDNGNCSGCNGDLRHCTDYLRQCSGSEHCYDCTGCKAPEIC